MARFGRLALGAVFAAVVIVGFVLPLFVKWQYAAISVGDEVRHSRYPGQVERIEGDTATVRTFDGELVTVPVGELTER